MQKRHQRLLHFDRHGRIRTLQDAPKTLKKVEIPLWKVTSFSAALSLKDDLVFSLCIWNLIARITYRSRSSVKIHLHKVIFQRSFCCCFFMISFSFSNFDGTSHTHPKTGQQNTPKVMWVPKGKRSLPTVKNISYLFHFLLFSDHEMLSYLMKSCVEDFPISSLLARNRLFHLVPGSTCVCKLVGISVAKKRSRCWGGELKQKQEGIWKKNIWKMSFPSKVKRVL